MNKKIKGYELYKMIAEKKLKNPVKLIDNKEEIWNFDGNNFIPITSKSVNDVTFAEMEFVILDLETFGVEILEDEEKIDIQGIKEMEYLEDYEADKTDIRLNRDKINEILKAVKQLDKKINKEE